MNNTNHGFSEMIKADEPVKSVNRRNFLRGASLTTVAGALVMASCKKNSDSVTPVNVNAVDLGSGDVGILNYAYALEQLEAAFYIQVISTPYSGMTDIEKSLLTDIRDHEIIHRDFFKTALGANAIQALEVNFTGIDFTSRASVLGTAKVFEDTGVSAYNGAGKLIVTPDYLLLAGKIVSVEARHAAFIRDLIAPGTFADGMDADGLDMSRTPSEVFAIAGTYVKTKLNISNLPTS